MGTTQDNSLRPALERYRYSWPPSRLTDDGRWCRAADGALLRDMPETVEDLSLDSRWPALFPSPMCLVTAAAGRRVALEKVVGASIVNRFPYVMALSFCRRALSSRHYERIHFTNVLETGGHVAVQFLPPGPQLDQALDTIAAIPDEQTGRRVRAGKLETRSALDSSAPVFSDAHLVYEGRLVEPTCDFDGRPIYQSPWLDVGSHRIYFLEITSIQLREDIARGTSQLQWRSLPVWDVETKPSGLPANETPAAEVDRYTKGYTAHYAFPAKNTIAFEADGFENGMAVRALPRMAREQVETDNDAARWPCFFPSSVGMITSWAEEGIPNIMPCGSTTVVSRHPLTIAPCVSYAAINDRYAPRASLDILRKTGRFGCGVPYIDNTVLNAIRICGNVSISDDRAKVSRTGLAVAHEGGAPILTDLPVHFDCEIKDEISLGTHVMFLGEVRQIRIHPQCNANTPLEWCPWADVAQSVESPAGTGLEAA